MGAVRTVEEKQAAAAVATRPAWAIASPLRVLVIAGLLAFVLLGLPAILDNYWLQIMTSVVIYSIVTLGLGLLIGRVGMVSLCQFALLAVGALVWIANRPGSAGDGVRALLLRLMPETGGRGLWGSRARQRLIESLLREGRSSLVLDPSVHLVMSACAVDDGRMRYFVNWDPGERFRHEVGSVLGEVVRMRTTEDVVTAAVASSAIPVLFEPVRIDGRDHVDGGVFSNQPLHAVLADEADAIIVVLLTPSAGPSPISERVNLLALGARLLELGNWRDLQTELRSLPAGWSRDARPARVCVVEPALPLEGGVLGFHPARARDHIARGAADAEDALRNAGWWTATPSPAPGEAARR